jgi:hypothetical protein
MLTQNQDYIIDHLGGQSENSWQDIVEWLSGKSVDEIEAELNQMFREEDNRDFAQMIYDELN